MRLAVTGQLIETERKYRLALMAEVEEKKADQMPAGICGSAEGSLGLRRAGPHSSLLLTTEPQGQSAEASHQIL
jgi:hypothetical protein